MIVLIVAFAGLRGALAIALAISAVDIATHNDQTDLGDQIFFFVTYLVSLTLLINGTLAEWVIIRLGLVKDPNSPLGLFDAFIRGRMANGVHNHLMNYFEEEKNNYGEFDFSELTSLCPALKVGDESGDADERVPTYGMLTVNPLLVHDMKMIMRVSLGNAELMAQRFAPANRTQVDEELLAFTRATFLQVKTSIVFYIRNFQNVNFFLKQICFSES